MISRQLIPGKMVPGMGRAMDRVTGESASLSQCSIRPRARQRVVERCRRPITSSRPVDVLVTELIAFPQGRATSLETASGVSADRVVAATEAELVISERVPEMARS
jgi:acetate CoA/acetoacetate CoA-transferase beta subunit